ncbi:MAG: GMC family oxidoreductase [Bdellovibrionota bacterium]
MSKQNINELYDFIVIGSGFGGSVSAMRLAQKGYSVAILEAGKRWRNNDFPKSNWDLRRYFWMPLLRCFGPQAVTLLKGVMVLRGFGVGGGSLIYANTLMKPARDVFNDPRWPKGHEWDKELSPFFDEARRMLGVVPNEKLFAAEHALHAVGKRLGVENTFHPTEVGVFFGEPDKEVDDPYFFGNGPKRVGCNHCGGCMVGCRYRAKNTLDYNYLYFAEKWGAVIFPETAATRILPRAVNGGTTWYEVETSKPTSWFGYKNTFKARNVIIAAGVLGSVELLLKNRDVYRTLTGISSKLGFFVRTNGESLLGSTSFDRKKNYSEGIAIGAAIHPDPETKIEAVRYPNGSGAMRLLSVPLTPDGSRFTRPLKLILRMLIKLPRMLRLCFVRDWARSTVILLVMQSVDRQMRLKLGGWFGFWPGIRGFATDRPIPSFLPVAQRAAVILACEMGGEPQNVISEVLLGTPATAHILGGCVIGDGRESGVIDTKHEVFGHKGLYVCDGSVIPCNLGVNPSLTISTLAERFATQFPLRAGFSEEEYKNRLTFLAN